MIHIIVGSMLGASEYVADAIAEFLDSKNIPSQIHLHPELCDIPHNSDWLIITSTHGAGDLPDNIQSFAEQLPTTTLNNVRYQVIALGDSSYDTFCEGGKTMHQLLRQCGAVSITEPHLIDVLEHTVPEDNAVAWFSDHCGELTGEPR